jgi:hemolysin D
MPFDRIIGMFDRAKQGVTTLFMNPARDTAFLPAALEIIETPASPAGRATAATIIGFFVIALLWACIGSVDIIATAPGKIVSTERTKIIQPFETGVVRAIHVRDGQTVKSGDVLIEIDSTINSSERDRVTTETVVAELEVARLKAALAVTDDPIAAFKPPAGAAPGQVELQRTLLANQVAEIHARLSGLDLQIAQNEGNHGAVASTIDKITKTLPMLREQARIRATLAKKGYGSRIAALTTEQDLIEHQQELEVQRGRLAEAEAGVSKLRQQRAEAQAEYQRTTMTALAQAEQKAASLHEQVLQATQKYRLQTLRAPVDGTVQQLSVHTEGGVVTPAQALLAIVPSNSQLEIEAMVSNRDIGFVRDGQPAEIKIDTFNFTRYGLVHGAVQSVSQDAIARETPVERTGTSKQGASESDSSEPKGQELVYAARVSCGATQMQIDDRLVSLSPGMAVTVEIKTGTRHVIDYLLSPLARAKHQALRER